MACCYSPSPSPPSSSSSSDSSQLKRSFFLFITSNNNNNWSYSSSIKRRNITSFKSISSSLTDQRTPTNYYPPSYNPLVYQAARLLGPPARFEASKLRVVFMGEDEEQQEQSRLSNVTPRTYTLSHCDLTANLTLTISNTITLDQLKGWYNRDDVVAEWKKVKEEMRLNIHCHVSGPNVLLDVAAEFRYHIFTKELPLVLQAVLYGDSMLFKEHPELMESLVMVYFHSSSKKYNRVECWGALKNATQGRQEDQMQSLISTGCEKDGGNRRSSLQKWGSPKSIFQALVTFLL